MFGGPWHPKSNFSYIYIVVVVVVVVVIAKKYVYSLE